MQRKKTIRAYLKRRKNIAIKDINLVAVRETRGICLFYDTLVSALS